MKTSLIFILTLFSTTSIHSEFSVQEKTNCNTAKNSTFLSNKEQEVIYYINLARVHPAKFSKLILQPYLEKHPNYSKKYTKSLLRLLQKRTSIKTLKPEKDLYSFAFKHAYSTGKAGKVGHRSTRGKSFKKRSKNLTQKYKSVGENIHYGSDDALEIVIDLLIDDGIRDLGHRQNILDPQFKYASVSIQNHKKFKFNCVIDFASERK